MKRKFLAVLLSSVLLTGMMPAAAYGDTAAADGSNGTSSAAAGDSNGTSVGGGGALSASADGSDGASVGGSSGAASSDAADAEEQPASTDNVSSDVSSQSETAEGEQSGTDSSSSSHETSEIDADQETVIESDEKDPDRKKQEIPLPDPGTITGFELLSEEERTISLDSRDTWEELEEKMPQSVYVYLDHSAAPVELPVTWVSENNYETTDESYYIFWADWDRELFPLSEDFGAEDYIHFVEVVIDSSVMMAGSGGAGLENIAARAHQMVDIRWTPLQNVDGFSSNEDQLTVYSGGTTYNGIPYGQQVYSGTWVPNTTDFDTFLQAVDTAGSPMYLSRGGYGSMNSTYYANDCSSFVSYCYGLPRMTTWAFGYSSQFTPVSGNSIYNAEVGDSFNRAGSHIEIITALNRDAAGKLVSVEVCEQTPPKARCVIYTPEQVQKLISSGYTLIRYSGRGKVAKPVSYSGYDLDRQDPVKVDYSAEEASRITVRTSEGGSVFNIRVTGLECYGNTRYEAAVWSQTGGQDDIRWIELKRQTDASYTASVKASSFRHGGTFLLHLYKKGPLQNICIKGTEFSDKVSEDPAKSSETADVTAEQVKVENLNETAGTCRIRVSGVSCADGVKQILIPVWSDPDQKDIVWYTARKLNSTDWYADMNLSRHGKDAGTFHIHVYGTNRAGKQNFCGNTSVEFKKQEAKISVSEKKTSAEISAEHLSLPGGIQTVLVPTWSKEGGQDDIRWETASFTASEGKASVTVHVEDYRHYGEFISHVYAQDPSGKMHFMGAVSYSLEEPAYVYNEVTGALDQKTGGFTVQIAHPRAEAGQVTGIQTAVWSGSGQKDIRWYSGKKQSDGSFVISGSIADHNGLGTYYCHVYGNVKGKLVYLGQTGFTAAASMEEFRAGDTKDGVKVSVSLEGLESPAAFSRVQAAVWSEKNGQDDLVWYNLNGPSGAAVKAGQKVNLSGSADIRKHKDTGRYFVHVYGVTARGTYCLLRADSMNVGSTAQAFVTVTDDVRGDGKVSVSMDVKDSNWSFSGVRVPVWFASDQSDIVWYTAAKAADGSRKIEIDKKKHKNHTGTCQIHVYLNYDNGIFGFAGAGKGELV